jgi:hypothetical protein
VANFQPAPRPLKKGGTGPKSNLVAEEHITPTTPAIANSRELALSR